MLLREQPFLKPSDRQFPHQPKSSIVRTPSFRKIAALKLDDVNRAVARHLSADRLVSVRAGDFSKNKSSEKK